MNAACKVVDNSPTILLFNGLNLLGNGCFQSSNSEWVILVNVVLEEPPVVLEDSGQPSEVPIPLQLCS